jgi:hypothetical protein
MFFLRADRRRESAKNHGKASLSHKTKLLRLARTRK